MGMGRADDAFFSGCQYHAVDSSRIGTSATRSPPRPCVSKTYPDGGQSLTGHIGIAGNASDLAVSAGDTDHQWPTLVDTSGTFIDHSCAYSGGVRATQSLN